MWHTGHGVHFSSASILSGLRTILSIFRLYCGSIFALIIKVKKKLQVKKEQYIQQAASFCKCVQPKFTYRFSGRISTAANSKADFLSPARWHSMTVSVKIGTTWAGNLLILRATLINTLAALLCLWMNLVCHTSRYPPTFCSLLAVLPEHMNVRLIKRALVQIKFWCCAPLDCDMYQTI